MTVQEVLEAACNKRQLNHNDHFLRFNTQGPDQYRIPEKSSFMEHEVNYLLMGLLIMKCYKKISPNSHNPVLHWTTLYKAIPCLKRFYIKTTSAVGNQNIYSISSLTAALSRTLFIHQFQLLTTPSARSRS